MVCADSLFEPVSSEIIEIWQTVSKHGAFYGGCASPHVIHPDNLWMEIKLSEMIDAVKQAMKVIDHVRYLTFYLFFQHMI